MAKCHSISQRWAPNDLGKRAGCDIIRFHLDGLSAETIAVRHREGSLHGFLSVRTSEGKIIATGDLNQVPDDDRITSRLTFRFKDGSIDEETTIYSQRKIFRLISDHLVEKGPSFPDPVDMLVEMESGNVTVHANDGEGKDRVNRYHFDFPPDLANGMVLTLLKNISSDASEVKVSFLAPGSKPVLVKLSISPGGQEKFLIEDFPRNANRFVARAEIEGILVCWHPFSESNHLIPTFGFLMVRLQAFSSCKAPRMKEVQFGLRN